MSQPNAAADRIEDDLGFDPDSLRERYRVEREKRLRPDGNEQYVEPTGDFSHYVDDPWVEPGFTRDSIEDEVETLIIGGGFAGLSVGAQLRMAGFDHFRIIEKGGDFGGTWHWNRYPGAQCDIESHIYLPLLEETGYIPKEKYSYAAEIRGQALRIAETFDLYRDVLFQTSITDLRWDDASCKWTVTTDRGDKIKARFVIKTNGTMDRPKLPGIPGISSFRGHTFHTSRWDYDYTGGNAEGGLTKLADKRVAVIGTGATAIQVVPYVARDAKHLHVVQRTPSSVDVRGNAPTDPEWIKTLTPGWQRRRRENFVALTSGIPQKEDFVADGWTDAVRKIGGFFMQGTDGSLPPEEMKKAMEIADFRKMNEIRSRVDNLVEDKEIAEALKPWYRQFCKRPTFNDDYLPTFNRPNVTLIDTQGRGPDRITETGLVFDGVDYPVDCIIFATGFEVGTAYTRRAGFETFGREGLTLSEAWSSGPRSLHGFYTHGFPNLFHIGVGQNGVSYARTYTIDEQAEHVADVLRKVKSRGGTYVEPEVDAEQNWVATIKAKSGDISEFQSQCTPGYYNNEGQKSKSVSVISQAYGGGPVEFHQLIREWRQTGLEGLKIA